MSTPPVCPQCQFPLTSAGVLTPKPGGGTMTVLPDGSAAVTPPVPFTPQPGVPARIGRFEVRRFLGGGGFGIVYEAFDPVLKRTVALKIPRPERIGTEHQVARFQREARSAGLLSHPNIVAVFDSGSDGAYHYIASAFVPGQPLSDLMAEGKPLPSRQAAEIVRKLADALAYAHKQGVILEFPKESGQGVNGYRGCPHTRLG